MEKGYYQTPNKMIPLNDREPGELAPIAIKQLEEYVKVARYWPVERHIHNTPEKKGQPCWCCGICDQTIWFVCDPYGTMYTYTTDEILALKVAHIRQSHAEVINA